MYAANTDVQLAGGVAGALPEVAGEDSRRAATRKAPIGPVVETWAYDLHMEYDRTTHHHTTL